MPVKTVNGVPIYVKDVAHVHMGYAVQTNVVRRDGRRAVLMTILKGEGASTLDVVERVRAALPGIQAQMPPELKMELLFDQSVFVRAAVDGRAQGGGDRGRADGADDPAVPRLVAEHAHRRRLDPAVDPHVDHRPVGAGPVAQHHDARRHGPGGRHPGGRRHGGDSRTSTATSASNKPIRQAILDGARRSPCRRSSRRWRSASSSCRCCS